MKQHILPGTVGFLGRFGPNELFLNDFDLLLEHMCCAGFRGDWFTGNRRRTFDGNWIAMQRHLDGSLTAGDSHVITCDQQAKNGVIHIVEHVILPKQSTVLPTFLSGTRRLGLPGMELIFSTGK